MREALIGYSGFVGGNLKQQHKFDYYFNSANFRSLRGDYDLVICSGVYSAKWLANKNPQEDKANISALSNVLTSVRTNRFVLISTIDVYPILEGVDEDYDCHAVPNHPYGTHRLEFEDFVRRQFQNSLIVRLPGLFGQGLKKNVIFDLLNNNCLATINSRSSFQYYDLSNLWSDIELLIKSGIRLVNLFTEPIVTQEIIDSFFPGTLVGQQAGLEVHYDVRTKYAHLFGPRHHYVRYKDEVLTALRKYVELYLKK